LQVKTLPSLFTIQLGMDGHGMKTIIAGGRDYQLTPHDYAILDGMLARGEITEVVCGGATGADECGRLWAIKNGFKPIMFPVTKDEWNRFGKKAGPMRNQKMADYAEQLVAFWDGESRGTKDMINKAEFRKLVVAVVLTKAAKPASI
jgi:hypothetical protein